jgi:hypothetical protein
MNKGKKRLFILPDTLTDGQNEKAIKIKKCQQRLYAIRVSVGIQAFYPA